MVEMTLIILGVLFVILSVISVIGIIAYVECNDSEYVPWFICALMVCGILATLTICSHKQFKSDYILKTQCNQTKVIEKQILVPCDEQEKSNKTFRLD